MNNAQKTLIGLGVTGAIIAALGLHGFAGCNSSEVQLDYYGHKGNVRERVCLEPEQYLVAKQALLDEVKDETKGYDFDINNRDLLFAVLNLELKNHEGFDGNLSKDLVINLLTE